MAQRWISLDWMYWGRFRVFEVSWIFSQYCSSMGGGGGTGAGGRFWVEAFRIRVSRKIWTPLCCDDRFMGNCFWIDLVVTKTLSLIILFLDWRHVTFYRHWWELLWSFHGYTLILWLSPFIPKNAAIVENVEMKRKETKKHLWCEKSKRSCLLGRRPLDFTAAPGV